MRRSFSGRVTRITTVFLIIFFLSLLSFTSAAKTLPRGHWRNLPMHKRADFYNARDVRPGEEGPAVKAASSSTSEPAASTSQSSPPTSRSTSTTPRPSSTFTPPPPASTAPQKPTTTSVTKPVETPPPVIAPTTSTFSTFSPPAPITTPSSSSFTVPPLITQSSSSSSLVTVTAPSTTLAVGPLTTSIAPTFSVAPSASTPVVPLASPSANGASKSFFANTGAVAGTFSAVGVVGIVLVVIAFCLLNKKRRRAASNDEEFFEKIDAIPASYGATGGRGMNSPDPIYPAEAHMNAHDAHDGYQAYGGTTDTNLHGDNHAHPQTANPYPMQEAADYNYAAESYGLQYPPGTAYTTQELQNAWSTTRSPVAYPSSQPHPYADPFSVRAETSRPVVNNNAKPSVARGVTNDSQDSDSFYGRD